MNEAVPRALEAWESFYVIVGSSAGALTGLQFVVMTLIASAPPSRNRGATISAYGTPNVVHFCGALLVSAILSMPWSGLRAAAVALEVCGLAGVVYSVIVTMRARRQQDYQPVFEDWLWHSMLPVLAYLTLLAGGAVLGPQAVGVLFPIGAAVLLLVFIGIHNAWDTVTYLAIWRDQPSRDDAPPEAPPPASGGDAGAANATVAPPRAAPAEPPRA